jgi:PIN domain nuclease of toxin-antitoxin system
MIHVIDTHALTRYIEDHRRLGPAGRAIFSDPGSVLVVPTIVLAEARFMIFKNKANIVWHDITRLMADDGRFVPVALTLEILDRTPDNLEMHDGIIVATATTLREASGEDVRLITRDKDIRDCGLVETVW